MSSVRLHESVEMRTVEVYSLHQMMFVGRMRLAFEFEEDVIHCHMTEMPSEKDDKDDLFFLTGVVPGSNDVYEIQSGYTELEKSRFNTDTLEAFIYKL